MAAPYNSSRKLSVGEDVEKSRGLCAVGGRAKGRSGCGASVPAPPKATVTAEPGGALWERTRADGKQRLTALPCAPPPAAPPTAAGGPQATIRGWTEKQNVVCPHGGMSVSFKEDGNSDTREVRRTQNDKRCLAPLTGGRWRGHSRSQREGRVTGWGGEAGEGRDWLTGTEF